ncbi:hypothetical protein KC727_02075 [Candidatus Kaiserbacteria bacterium]|nr:hypothetical protein [Candidatus Kaiserbacteria bacterium]
MKDKIVREVEGALERVDKTAQKVIATTEQFAEPYRKSALQRFPILFTLLATVGITATFLALEQILMSIDVFVKHPMVLLVLGIVLLAITGQSLKRPGG